MEDVCKVCGGHHTTGTCTEKQPEQSTQPVVDEQGTEKEKKHALRLKALHSVREFAAGCGYREIKPPAYERQGDKETDIILYMDTMAYGTFDVRIDKEAKINIKLCWELNSAKEGWKDHRGLFETLVGLKKKICDLYQGVVIDFYAANSVKLDIPDEITARKKRSDDGSGDRGWGGAPRVQLDKQVLNFDPRSGVWRGSPRKG